MKILKISIACDHAGYKLKEKLVKYLLSEQYEINDLGTYSEESVDYPDFGHILAVSVERKQCDLGISICGSGNGINMVVNKHPGIRSAICWNEEISRLARAHNDANVCALPGRFINYETAVVIVKVFLTTGFDSGRHERRINKIPLI
ncbi:MAG: ribose 5-phosphate isomerase B [Bacteroidetes bacterium]|nr:MAG: ribose 5-phosphate isomerase B [Bacteroidota bacterium]RLD80357.1 MAG: ribose 5-phosphate isomerase B [Bacteroidota bacterium]